MFIILGLCAALSIDGLGSTRIEFTANEMHGLVGFMETISGHPHRSESLKAYFEGSRFNTPDAQKRIEEFRELYSDLDQTIEFPGYPRERHAGIGVAQLYLVRSAYSKDLKDFQERTVGLVPIAVQASYFKLLTYFSSIYRDLVWNPSRKKLGIHRRQLEAIGQKAGLADMFRKAKAFYRSDWPEGAPFRMALYPVPVKKGVRHLNP